MSIHMCKTHSVQILSSRIYEFRTMNYIGPYGFLFSIKIKIVLTMQAKLCIVNIFMSIH